MRDAVILDQAHHEYVRTRYYIIPTTSINTLNTVPGTWKNFNGNSSDERGRHARIYPSKSRHTNEEQAGTYISLKATALPKSSNSNINLTRELAWVMTVSKLASRPLVWPASSVTIQRLSLSRTMQRFSSKKAGQSSSRIAISLLSGGTFSRLPSGNITRILQEQKGSYFGTEGNRAFV